MKQELLKACFRGIDLLGLSPDSLAWAVRWLARRELVMTPRMVERAYYVQKRVDEKETARLRRYAGQAHLDAVGRVLQVLRRDCPDRFMSSGRLLHEVNQLATETITPADLVTVLCNMHRAGYIALDVNETRTLVKLTDAGRFLFIVGKEEEDYVEDAVGDVIPHGMELLARSTYMDGETRYRLMELLGLLPWVKAWDELRLAPGHLRTTLLRSGDRSVQVRIDFHLADDTTSLPF